MRKNVLIIGGSGGIGSHLVTAFLNSGCSIISTYCGNDFIDSTNSGSYIRYMKLDVTNEVNCVEISDRIIKEYEKLDVLIYASGVFEDKLIENMELSTWKRIVDINLTGAFLVTKYMLPALRNSGSGRILYIGSVMGDTGCYGSSCYSATKAGLIGLAKSVALENAKKM